MNIPTIEFEALDAEALLAEDASIEGKNHALRIGVTKDVLYTNDNSGVRMTRKFAGKKAATSFADLCTASIAL